MELCTEDQFHASIHKRDAGLLVLPNLSVKDGVAEVESDNSCTETISLSQEDDISSGLESSSSSKENESYPPSLQSVHVQSDEKMVETSLMDVKVPLETRKALTSQEQVDRQIRAATMAAKINLMKNQAQTNPSTSTRSIMVKDTPKTKKKPSSSELYERLAATNTKNMERRRRIERDQFKKKKNSKEFNGKDFKCFIVCKGEKANVERRESSRPAPSRRDEYARKSVYGAPARTSRQTARPPTVTRSQAAHLQSTRLQAARSAPPPKKRERARKSLYENLAKTETYATASMKGIPQPGRKPLQQSQQKKPKQQPKADLNDLFSRLANQDTIASSRKTTSSAKKKNRPVILTEYEKKREQEKKKKILAEKKKMRKTSATFFDALSKDTTKSLMYRELDAEEWK